MDKRRAFMLALIAIATVTAAASLVFAAGCGGGDEGLPGGPSSERMTLRPAGSAEGSPLGYVEYLPPGYGDGAPRPLLVFLHGSAEAGSGSEEALSVVFNLGIARLIERDEWPEDRSFVVLMPQYPSGEARECRLGDEVDSFLRFALDRYDVDETRVYLTGISCGAGGTWDYLAAHGGEMVAAAVPIAGPADQAFARAGCDLGRVPIWAFHGGADPIVPKTRIETPMSELEGCTGPPPVDVRLTVYPGAFHDAWSQTYDLSAGHDVFAWLLEHQRS